MPAGKICYLEIPTDHVEISANFYAKVFYWKIRVRGDGERAFDDATGTVSGAWVLGRPPAREPGMLVYVMVESTDATLSAVSNAGGKRSRREPHSAQAARRLPRSAIQAET